MTATRGKFSLGTIPSPETCLTQSGGHSRFFCAAVCLVSCVRRPPHPFHVWCSHQFTGLQTKNLGENKRLAPQRPKNLISTIFCRIWTSKFLAAPNKNRGQQHPPGGGVLLQLGWATTAALLHYLCFLQLSSYVRLRYSQGPAQISGELQFLTAGVVKKTHGFLAFVWGSSPETTSYIVSLLQAFVPCCQDGPPGAAEGSGGVLGRSLQS